MELTGIEIVFVHRGGIRLDIVGNRCRIVTERYIVGVYEINIRMLTESGEEWTTHVITLTPYIQLIPSHAGHLVLMALRLEAFDLSIEDSDTVHISLLRVSA
jgi:hypothetical protein